MDRRRTGTPRRPGGFGVHRCKEERTKDPCKTCKHDAGNAKQAKNILRADAEERAEQDGHPRVRVRPAPAGIEAEEEDPEAKGKGDHHA